MKYGTRLLASALLIIAIPGTARSAVGCMDSSHYLTQAIDHKELHYVSCDCACDSSKLLRTHGTCLLCQHVHMPREWIIMRNGKQVATTLQYRSTSQQDTNSLSDATQYLISKMIAQYKKNK